MRYTTIRMVSSGALFYEAQRGRLAPEGQGALDAFARFVEAARPGVYRLWADGARLTVEARGPTTFADGMSVRFERSPFARSALLGGTEGAGAFPKPPPGGPLDHLRAPGLATLLTTPDGDELLEAASAAILALRDGRLVAVPLDRPRVRSVSEAALDAVLHLERSPLYVGGQEPIVLINAVVGVCAPEIPGREPFPRPLLERLRGLCARSVGAGGAE